MLTILTDSAPDELIRADGQQWRKLVVGAVFVMDYLITQATAGRDVLAPLEQRQALSDLLPVLAQLADDQQQLYAIHLAHILGLHYDYCKSKEGLSRQIADRLVFVEKMLPDSGNIYSIASTGMFSACSHRTTCLYRLATLYAERHTGG